METKADKSQLARVEAYLERLSKGGALSMATSPAGTRGATLHASRPLQERLLRTANYSLLTTHYLPLTNYYGRLLLRNTCYLLLYHSLLTTYHSPLTTYHCLWPPAAGAPAGGPRA